MIYDNFIAHAGLIATMATAGLLFGLLYFAALKQSVTLFVGGKGWPGPLVLTLGRIAAAAGFLFVAAKPGAVALLSGFVGFLMARAIASRAHRRVG